jgi:hypothetical protein
MVARIISAVLTITLFESAISVAADKQSPDMQADVPPRIGFTIPQPTQEVNDAAEEGRKRLERLLAGKEKLARQLGFKSPGDANEVATQLGKPFAIVFIDFNKAMTRQPADMGAKALVWTSKFIYPVIVHGDVQSSITVSSVQNKRQTGQIWRATRWGSPGLIRLLVDTRNKAGTSGADFLISVPTVSRHFLGAFVHGKFKMFPLANEPSFGFEAAQGLDPDSVFRKLFEEAKSRGRGAG